MLRNVQKTTNGRLQTEEEEEGMHVIGYYLKQDIIIEEDIILLINI